MRTDKRAPGGRPLTAGGDPLGLQDARNRRSSDTMAHILQGTLDAPVTPSWILRGHPDDQPSDLGEHRRSPRPPPSVSPFPRNQLTVPPENGFWRDGSPPLAAPRVRVAVPAPRAVGADHRLTAPAGCPVALLARGFLRGGRRSHRAAHARAIQTAPPAASEAESHAESTP